MKFKMAVDQHTTQLLKISYLYVQDLQRAQQLVHEAYRKLSAKNKEDLPFNQMKPLFIKYVVEGCHVYFRSWSYRVTKGKRKQAFVLPQEVEQPESLAKLLNLPIKEREVIILHFVALQSSAEIAELLHISIGTVRTRLHKAKQNLQGVFDGEDLMKPIQTALGDWTEISNTLKEMLLGEMLNGTSKQKRRYLKPLITLGVVAIAIGLGAWIFAPEQALESEKGQVQSFPVSEGEASRI